MPRVAILAASVLLTLSVAGCGAPPLGPEGEAAQLELVDARLTPERDRVILRFDAELAELEGVAAEDFRLSRASTVVGYPVGDPQMKEELSVYEDWVTTGYIGGGVVSTDPVELATVELGPGPDELSLRFAEPIDESACEWLAAQQADAHPTEEAGLFPHYEPGESPLRSVHGDPLRAFGAAWVEFDGGAMVEEGLRWPSLEIQVRVACPE